MVPECITAWSATGTNLISPKNFCHALAFQFAVNIMLIHPIKYDKKKHFSGATSAAKRLCQDKRIQFVN